MKNDTKALELLAKKKIKAMIKKNPLFKNTLITIEFKKDAQA